jgi:hypothetical protein
MQAQVQAQAQARPKWCEFLDWGHAWEYHYKNGFYRVCIRCGRKEMLGVRK